MTVRKRQSFRIIFERYIVLISGNGFLISRNLILIGIRIYTRLFSISKYIFALCNYSSFILYFRYFSAASFCVKYSINEGSKQST